ncbi:MAG: (2Fe-2S) ferredoxin domain-containing protein [bacterium]|nr:MAG: (2Fe-2S) ferredoxin domain-containing protein [bacterium]
MSLYQKHVFVCENLRDDADVRGSCAQKGSIEFRSLLKKEIELRGLKGKIRINKAGCLGTCKQGISMVIYPQGIWYGRLSESDIPEIVEKTLVQNEVISRLLMSFMKNRSF